jgi:hypothetical protein
MSDLSKNTPVHLINVSFKGDRAGWFCGTEQRQRDPKSSVLTLYPLVNDDPRESKSMSYELAIIAQRRFREELGILFRLALEQHGEFIDEAFTPANEEPDVRIPLLVCPDDLIPLDLWFTIRPANTVFGRCWCCRPQDIPSLRESLGKIDTIYGRPEESPEEVLERARRHWKSLGLKVEGSPHPNADERDNAELKQILQEPKNPGQRRRPGDL